MTTPFPRAGLSRRRFLAASVGTLGASFLSSCQKQAAGQREVVLYSSVDDPILRPIVAEFEKQSGIRVALVGDTEATKSTGLIMRLLQEKASPRADVWWSSEQLGVMELAKAGVLEPMAEPALVAGLPGEWPQSLRDEGGLWYGFACRARVIVHSTKRLPQQQAPRTLGGLLAPGLKGRVGIAAPGFGTTRVHMAALVAERGAVTSRGWLEAMKSQGLKVYPGNSAVVRAISQGEIDIGLTDTDDVHAGRANGWEVGMVFEDTVDAASPTDENEADPTRFAGGGALVIPNTVARVRGGPNAANARLLIDFILGETTERLLAESDSRNEPLREALRLEKPELILSNPWHVSPQRIAASLSASSAMVREVLGPG